MSDDRKRETATDGDVPRKAPWQTPTLEVVDVATETEGNPGPGGDFTAQS